MINENHEEKTTVKQPNQRATRKPQS
jgi:hypothetical protein